MWICVRSLDCAALFFLGLQRPLIDLAEHALEMIESFLSVRNFVKHVAVCTSATGVFDMPLARCVCMVCVLRRLLQVPCDAPDFVQWCAKLEASRECAVYLTLSVLL